MAASYTQPAVSSQVEAEEVAKLAKQISDHAEILYQTWRSQQQPSPVSPSPSPTSSVPPPPPPSLLVTAMTPQPPPLSPSPSTTTTPVVRYRQPPGTSRAPPPATAATTGSGTPPAVSKRHSQYLRNAVNLLGSPGLEKQLEELVQNFIVEDKVRNAQRMKSAEAATAAAETAGPSLRFQRRLPGGSPVLSAVVKYEQRQGISSSKPGDVGGDQKMATKTDPATDADDEATNFLRQVEEDLINALKSGYVLNTTSKKPSSPALQTTSSVKDPPSPSSSLQRRLLSSSPPSQQLPSGGSRSSPSPLSPSSSNRLVPFPPTTTTVAAPSNGGGPDGYESAASSSVSPRLSPEPLQLRTSSGGSFVFPGESLVSPVDYAKVRYQHAQQQDRLRVESVRSARALSPNSLNVVSETRSRFEGRGGGGEEPQQHSPGGHHQHLHHHPSSESWVVPIHEGPSAEATLQMAEWFRRKAARKGNLPHPELTEQQRQHIKERCMSPTTYYNAAGVPIRPFLTRGSVAERVLIFEKCPTEVRDRTGGGSLGTWRNNEVQSRAQTYARVDVGEAVGPSSSSRSKHRGSSDDVGGASATSSSNESLADGNDDVVDGGGGSGRRQLSANNFRHHQSHQQLNNLLDFVDQHIGSSTSTSGILGGGGGSKMRLETAAVVPASHSHVANSHHHHNHQGYGGNSLHGFPNHHHHHHHSTPVAGLPQSAQPSSSTLRRQARAKPAQIPRFYYPMGRPKVATELDQVSKRISDAFDALGQPYATRDDFSKIAKACDLPLYLKAPLFFCAVAQGCQVDCAKDGRTAASAASSTTDGTTSSTPEVLVGKKEFIDFWRRVLTTHHDVFAQFIYVLSRGALRLPKLYLLPEDFVAMVQDIVDTHPGLAFLREAQEFHFRYVRTVIARVYYCVNRSWSGRITLPELRRSNLIQVIAMLETEEDINQITEYFSYEHFYVIYCKFWELDRDHDLFIDRVDLARHADGAISSRMIDRIFSGAVTRGQGHVTSHRTPQGHVVRREEKHRMSYPEFIWFLISEEDKRHPTAIEYWFRCMDLDGDGFLSMYELEYFYEEQVQRLEAMGMEAMPFNDCLCQMLDLVQPAKSGMISLGDLKRCHQTPIFFDTFFNLEKYLEHEHRDPFAIQARDPENPDQQLSDWEKYCIEEYEQLVAEEGAGDATEILYDDDMDDDSADIDELSPNLDQIIVVDNGADGKHIVTEPDDDFADYADA